MGALPACLSVYIVMSGDFRETFCVLGSEPQSCGKAACVSFQPVLLSLTSPLTLLSWRNLESFLPPCRSASLTLTALSVNLHAAFSLGVDHFQLSSELSKQMHEDACIHFAWVFS